METTDNSYLAMWERVRKSIEKLPLETTDRDELDQLTKLLERAQKGELALRDYPETGLVVVNIHIPGVCTHSAPQSRS